MTALRTRLTGLLTLLFVLALIVFPVSIVHASNGSITLSSGAGTQGSGVTLTGSGFTPGSTFGVNMSNSVIASGIVATDGSISVSFSIPKFPRSTYSIYVTTSLGDNTTQPYPTYAILPQIIANRTTGGPGDSISIAGTGFTANATVTFFWDGAPIGTVMSDLVGTFENAMIVVPKDARGSHFITATDGGSAPSGVNFRVVASLVLSQNSVGSGSTITVSGSGFQPHSQISFFLDNAAISNPSAADASGNFAGVSITLPNTAPGTHVLKAADSAGNTMTAEISVASSLNLNPDNGPSGTAVAVTGKGFAAGRPVTLTFNNSPVTTSPASIVTDATGSFSANFNVPASGGGLLIVSASDGTNSGSANFKVAATGSLSPVSGPTGTAVIVAGSGMAPGARITVSYFNITVASSPTDSRGNYSTTFTVPPSGAGPHPIVVSDGNSSLSLNFTIVPTSQISAASGFVGMDISLTGNGFAPSKSITVSYDGSQIATSTSDAVGAFTVSLKAPVSKGGNHNIVVTDGANIANYVFAMDSTPPSAPSNLVPVDGIQAEPTPVFQWSSMTDPSGLTYSLQIARDPGFSNIVLQKQGLVNPAYKLTDVEQLKDVKKSEPYFWRVKAIDGASNESSWSSPTSFYVGFVLDSWVIPAIVAFFVVILAVVFFVVLRQRKH
jgi:hypothetical protein